MSPDARMTATIAATLGVTPCPEALVVAAAGTSVRNHVFVTAHARSCADEARLLVDRLIELPHSAQDQLLLLKLSLQTRMANLPRAASCDFVGEDVHSLKERAASALLASLDGSTDVREEAFARFCGCACQAASTCLDALAEHAAEERRPPLRTASPHERVVHAPGYGAAERPGKRRLGVWLRGQG